LEGMDDTADSSTRSSRHSREDEGRRHFATMSRSSTSKTNVAPGLIIGGDPRSP
jgi:hypothetical protein